MDPQVWHKVASISGVAALSLGTYGAHSFKPQDHSYNEVWRTASLYHLVHTAALVAAPMAKYPNTKIFALNRSVIPISRWIFYFGSLLTAGIIGFSGSGYTTAYYEDRKYSKLASMGGFAFIAAWGSLLF